MVGRGHFCAEHRVLGDGIYRGSVVGGPFPALAEVAELASTGTSRSLMLGNLACDPRGSLGDSAIGRSVV